MSFSCTIPATVRFFLGRPGVTVSFSCARFLLGLPVVIKKMCKNFLTFASIAGVVCIMNEITFHTTVIFSGRSRH